LVMVRLSFRHNMIPIWQMNFTEHIDLKAVATKRLKIGYTPDVLTDAGKLDPPMYPHTFGLFL